MKREKMSSSVEDYLEAVYLLVEEKDEVGTSDIASFLGVKLPSVTEMLRKLREKDLINYEKYGKITLTPTGKRMGEKISQRHEDLVSFLKFLGVDEDSAQLDACKVEHVVGQNTMEKLRKFLKFADEAPEKPTWLEHYREFMETGEHPECERRGE
ncbi:MAG: metal-dependent transcriptional regulator [Candidatus Hadarchaeota archaeon]